MRTLVFTNNHMLDDEANTITFIRTGTHSDLF